MSKNFNICCPECFSKSLYKYGKDKTGKQKYQCKTCHRQFTKDSSAKQKLNCPKCPICGAGTYLHHDYEHYSRFKCNSKKCNHIHVVLKKSVFYEPLAQEINSKFNFKRLRTNLNIVIDALYIYFRVLPLQEPYHNTCYTERILKFHMLPFTNGLKILVHYSKKSLKNICLKILILLMSGMLMKP